MKWPLRKLARLLLWPGPSGKVGLPSPPQGTRKGHPAGGVMAAGGLFCYSTNFFPRTFEAEFLDGFVQPISGRPVVNFFAGFDQK